MKVVKMLLSEKDNITLYVTDDGLAFPFLYREPNNLEHSSLIAMIESQTRPFNPVDEDGFNDVMSQTDLEEIIL